MVLNLPVRTDKDLFLINKNKQKFRNNCCACWKHMCPWSLLDKFAVGYSKCVCCCWGLDWNRPILVLLFHYEDPNNNIMMEITNGCLTINTDKQLPGNLNVTGYTVSTRSFCLWHISAFCVMGKVKTVKILLTSLNTKAGITIFGVC